MNKLLNEHYRIDPETGERTVEKVAYESQGLAYKYILDHYRDTRRDWDVYKCLVCGKYHIGHSKRVSYEEKYAQAKEDIKFLKELLEKRDQELIELKNQLCYYSNLQK